MRSIRKGVIRTISGLLVDLEVITIKSTLNEGRYDECEVSLRYGADPQTAIHFQVRGPAVDEGHMIDRGLSYLGVHAFSRRASLGVH